MAIPCELQIVKGYPSAASLGLSTVTDLVTTSYDLLTGAYVVYDTDGDMSYERGRPAVKAGGVWVDSSVTSGRRLIVAEMENVTDVVQLKPIDTSTKTQREAAVDALDVMIAAASEFWTSGLLTDPVYLRYKEVGALDEQYALIYLIEVDDDGEVLTLTIEREAAWRPLPPGSNPKLWPFFLRGLDPSTTAGAPAAGQFNHTNLTLNVIGGAANYQHQIEAVIRQYDEIGVPASRNYIDIPAALCKGNAPVAAAIHYDIQAPYAGINPPSVYIARSTIRDLYPAVDTNVALQRLKNTFNGGDATAVGGAGLVVTKVVDATNGLFSNGSTVTRYVLSSAMAAGGHAELTIGNWTRTRLHYTRRWGVFVRCRFTAGTPANVTLKASLSVGGVTEEVATTSRTLSGMVLNNWALRYLGSFDFTSRIRRASDGLGLDEASTATLRIYATKTNDGVAATFVIADVVLMPLDEPMIKAEYSPGIAAILTDTTGYMRLDGMPDASHLFADIPLVVTGQPIYLIPNKNNRIYFLVAPTGTTTIPTANINVAVDLQPRWYGVRS